MPANISTMVPLRHLFLPLSLSCLCPGTQLLSCDGHLITLYGVVLDPHLQLRQLVTLPVCRLNLTSVIWADDGETVLLIFDAKGRKVEGSNASNPLIRVRLLLCAVCMSVDSSSHHVSTCMPCQ